MNPIYLKIFTILLLAGYFIFICYEVFVISYKRFTESIEMHKNELMKHPLINSDYNYFIRKN